METSDSQPKLTSGEPKVVRAGNPSSIVTREQGVAAHLQVAERLARKAQVAREKKNEQDQPDQPFIHPTVTSVRMGFRLPPPLFWPQKLLIATIRIHVLRRMGSFVLWVDTSE